MPACYAGTDSRAIHAAGAGAIPGAAHSTFGLRPGTY